MVYSLPKGRDVLIIKNRKDNKMKKFDKEYSTQYTPEKDFLLQNGITPSFIKVVNDVITYKYTKTSKLFNLLSLFYKRYD